MKILFCSYGVSSQYSLLVFNKNRWADPVIISVKDRNKIRGLYFLNTNNIIIPISHRINQ